MPPENPAAFVLIALNSMGANSIQPFSLARKRARQLRWGGISVLCLGLCGAAMICWLGNRQPVLADELAMTGYNKPEQRQMGILYGKEGALIEGWSEDLKQPGTQAVLLLATTALLAGGCFYFAHLFARDAESENSEAA